MRQLPEAQRLYHELVGSRFGHPVKEHVAKGCNRIVRHITISTCKFQQTKGTDLREAKSLHVVHILVYILSIFIWYLSKATASFVPSKPPAALRVALAVSLLGPQPIPNCTAFTKGKYEMTKVAKNTHLCFYQNSDLN